MLTILQLVAVLVIVSAFLAPFIAHLRNGGSFGWEFGLMVGFALVTVFAAEVSYIAGRDWVTINWPGWLLFGVVPLVLAMVLYSRSRFGGIGFASAVLGVIAAFGLVFNVALHGATSWGWHWTIGGSVWVIILAVIILALAALVCFRAGNGVLGAVMVALGILLVVVALAATNISGDSTTATPKPSPSAPADTTPLPYHQRTASQCEDGYYVVYDRNAENALYSGGLPANLYPTAQSVVKKLTDVMHYDTRVLALYYMGSPLQKLQPITGEEQLRGTGTGDGCYSAIGRDVYNRYVALLASPLTKAVVAVAPAVGVNTGAVHNGPVYQQPIGKITYSRSAVKITYPNGTVVYIMRHCGNMVTPSPTPNVPPPPKTVCHSPGNGVTPPSGPPGAPPCAGKVPGQDVLKNPSVPAPVKGCSADGCGGGTATGPGHTVSASPPGHGTTGCGASGNDPCPSTAPTPSPTSSDDPTPGGGAPYPTPSSGPTTPGPIPTGPPTG